MSFRPSGYVGWCSTGATNIAEPTDAKKAVGWSTNEQPPSSYFNWIQQKQDAYIQYLDWKAALTPLVRHDFCYPTGVAPGTGFDDFAAFRLDLAQQLNQFAQAPGVVNLFKNSSGIGNFAARITPGVRDFRMEVVALAQQLGTSGSQQIGFPDHMAIVSTSSTGTWGLHFVPSGGSPTSVAFSGMTGVGDLVTFKKFVVERHGATMGVFINDSPVAYMPGAPFGYSGVPIDFGTAQQVRTGNNSMHLDRLAFDIRRDPT
jgi:hypothetical protein